MEIETRVDDLVDRWEELRGCGTPMTVEELCAGCPDLIAEVRRRVDALRAMDSALDTRVVGPPPFAAGRDGADSDPGPPEVTRATAAYRVGDRHDRGGLGVVFVAHQEELDRKVALKRIRPDKLRDASRRRFLREAAITARLQHPGIVPIYGLGQDDGGPFYTMPFIEGRTLQQAIAAFHGDERVRGDPGRRALGLRGLLQPFVTICQTMAYAHDRGVVHRDLKPSNLMLGPYGEALVMDWGLARRFGDDGGESGDGPSPDPSSEEVTATGEILGTPLYMSPEQARGEPAGPASDLFSLGLILYAILTGGSPFEGASRRAAIVPPRRRDPRLPRALEAVCLKAMATRPEDRYASARDLADDLTRWLADEPVSAWREPASDRARRWARRHRTGVAAGLVALVTLAIGLGAVAAVQVRANDRLRRAGAETTRALAATREAQARTLAALAGSEESRRQAEAVSRFLVEAFRSPDPSRIDRNVKVVDVLDRACSRLDKEFAGSPATRGMLLQALGLTYHGLGLYDRAIGLHTGAIAAREAAFGPDHLDTLASRTNLGNALWAAGRIKEAIEQHRATLERYEATLGPDHPDALKCRDDLALAYHDAGRMDEAIAQHEAVFQRRLAVLGGGHPDTLQSMNNLANAYNLVERWDRAIPLYEQALDRMKATLGPDHPETLTVQNNLANACFSSGRLADALKLREQTLDQRAVKLGPHHPDTVLSRVNLANSYYSAGRLDEAIPLFEEALEEFQAQLGPDHRFTLTTRNNLAVAYQTTGRNSRAIDLYEATLARIQARLAPDHPDALMSRINLANAYYSAGRLSESMDLHRTTLERVEAKLGPDHSYALACRECLAVACETLGRFGEAEVLYRDVLTRRRKALPPGSPLLDWDLAALGWNLLVQSRWSEAEPMLRESLAIRAKADPDGWSRYDAMSRLGEAIRGQGRNAEAEPMIVGGYEGMKAREGRIPSQSQSQVRHAAERLIGLYEEWGRTEQADAWKARLGMRDLPTDVFASP